ncbi:MAG TPA: DUF3108 domain-containing protein [Pyrinomonadaceae bacterium]|jgi:hypothetical protein|nr:DUF3108 domain-containing protein [Pyrinomonadaceae bacterium]
MTNRHTQHFLGRTIGVPLILVCALTFAVAQEKPRAPLPFERGEELLYQAEFTKGLLRSVDVAEFHFKSVPENISRGAGDPAVLHLTGDVFSKGLFPRIAGFKFHQHVESKADVEPFRALHTDKIEESGKRSRVLEAEFNHETRKVIWREKSPNPQGGAFDFQEPIQDVLTVIYYLRTQKLEVGKSFEVPVTDAGRVFRIVVTAKEEKELDTALGNVKAIRVEPAMFGETSLARGRGQLSIWITEDERHLPVRAQLKIDLGTFDIKLKRVTYPLAGN